MRDPGNEVGVCVLLLFLLHYKRLRAKIVAIRHKLYVRPEFLIYTLGKTRSIPDLFRSSPHWVSLIISWHKVDYSMNVFKSAYVRFDFRQRLVMEPMLMSDCKMLLSKESNYDARLDKVT